MRAARIGRGFSALFALLIWAMRSVQGTEHWVARASGALRLAARAMGVDTVREVRRGGCGGQLGGQQGRERENREGERARRLSRGGQWACRARTGCARDALQGGASRTGMRAQGTVSRAEGARAAGIAARGGPPYFFRVARGLVRSRTCPSAPEAPPTSVRTTTVAPPAQMYESARTQPITLELGSLLGLPQRPPGSPCMTKQARQLASRMHTQELCRMSGGRLVGSVGVGSVGRSTCAS